MLSLTREPGESLVIGDDIIVKVIKVTGNKVRLGVQAPNQVSVHREEIYRRLGNQSLATGTY